MAQRRTIRDWHPPLTWTVCNDPKAGTVTGYRKHMDARKRRDRAGRKIGKHHKICDACRLAAAERAYKYRNQRILNGGVSVQRTPGNGRHFKLKGGYLMIDATGTRRRLRALAVLGYSADELGKKLGIHGNGLTHIARARKRVYPETADKIKALYEELHMIPAPERTGSVGNGRKVVITRATRKGWLPPLAWEEETMDDPYAIPVDFLDARKAYTWFWNSATMTERIEYVLEHGLSVTRAPGRK